MDVKLVTLAAALMLVLYAPPSQGMQLYPCFHLSFSKFLAVFSPVILGKMVQKKKKMLARLSETVGNQFKIFYLLLGCKI